MTQAGPTAPAARRPIWAGPLVAGVCFGLAYGVSQRLLALNVGELIRFGQGFDVQVFPGTSLESLRLRFGAADDELRGNQELQELERQAAEPQPEASEVLPEAPPAPAEPAADPLGAGLEGGPGPAAAPAAAPAAPATPPPLPAAPAPVRP
ncbi:MAG: hypothetical protein ACKOE9_09385 [Vulcanococcus sp.]